MKRRKVLVTSAASDASVSAIRALARSGHEVHGADVQPILWGLRSRYAASHHVIGNATPKEYGEGLLALVRKLRPDVLLPIGTRAVDALARMRDEVEETTAVLLPSAAAIAAANNKAVAAENCDVLGIPHARTYSKTEAAAVLAAGGDRVGLVVKPEHNFGAARGVTYVSRHGDLERALAQCRARYGRALIQEHIPGGVDAMKTVIVLFSRDTRLIAAFTTRKLRQWPNTGGLTVMSRSTEDHPLVTQVLPFFEKWHWTGAAEVELKEDSRSGIDRVIEINPRFPAYLRFAQRCGLDLATLSVRLASGGDEPAMPFPSYRVGMTYMKPGLFLKSAKYEMRCRGIRGLRGTLVDFWSGLPLVADMLEDPIPFLGRMLEDSAPR